MSKIQNTLTITIDDATYDVDQTSAEIKNLVMYMDEWRQTEADLTSDLLRTRAAIQHIQNELLAALTAERAQNTTDPEPEQPQPPKIKKSKVSK